MRHGAASYCSADLGDDGAAALRTKDEENNRAAPSLRCAHVTHSSLCLSRPPCPRDLDAVQNTASPFLQLSLRRISQCVASRGSIFPVNRCHGLPSGTATYCYAVVERSHGDAAGVVPSALTLASNWAMHSGAFMKLEFHRDGILHKLDGCYDDNHGVGKVFELLCPWLIGSTMVETSLPSSISRPNYA
ncbi:unnamed protein product [Urochloa humidicola]